MEDVNSLWYKLCTVLVASQRFAVGKGPLSLEEYPCDVCQLKGESLPCSQVQGELQKRLTQTAMLME